MRVWEKVFGHFLFSFPPFGTSALRGGEYKRRDNYIWNGFRSGENMTGYPLDRISQVAALQSSSTSEAKASISESFAPKTFLWFFTKSTEICCIIVSLAISSFVSVFLNSYFNILELISIFFLKSFTTILHYL